MSFKAAEVAYVFAVFPSQIILEFESPRVLGWVDAVEIVEWDAFFLKRLDQFPLQKV